MADTLTDANCGCGEEQEAPFNPKKAPYPNRYNSGAQCIALGRVCDPISRELKDFKNTYITSSTLYPYVPMFSEGEGVLQFILEMCRLSPTLGGVMGQKTDFAAGGGMTVVRKKRSGFAVRNPKDLIASEQEFNSYADFIESTFAAQGGGAGIEREIQKMIASFVRFGNAGIEVTMTTVAGVPACSVKGFSADWFRYVAEQDMTVEDTGNRFMWIAPEWTNTYLSLNTPRKVPVWPNFEEVDGITRTFIHIKNEAIGRNFYGEPDWISGLYFAYLQYQQGKFTTTGYDQSWKAQVMLDIPTDTEDAERSTQLRNALEQAYTNGGSLSGMGGSRVVIHTRSLEEQPISIHEFATKTDENFHLAMKEISEDMIYQATQWTSMFSLKQQGSMGNSQEFWNMFRFKSATVIEPLQRKIMESVNQAMKLVENFVGYQNTSDLALALTSKFNELMNIDQQQQQTNSNA